MKKVHGSTISSILDKIEPMVQKQAKKHAAEAKRDRWDVPGFHYRWNSTIGHMIQVCLKDDELIFECTAWKDDAALRKRKWRNHNEKTLQVPNDTSKLDLRAVEQRLKALDKTVSGWKEADLAKEADLPNHRSKP